MATENKDSILDGIDLDALGIMTDFDDNSGEEKPAGGKPSPKTSLDDPLANPSGKAGGDGEDDPDEKKGKADPNAADDADDKDDKGGDDADDAGDDAGDETDDKDKTDKDKDKKGGTDDEPPAGDEPEPSLAQDIIKAFGYEDLDPNEYADDTMDSIKKVVTAVGERMARQELDGMFERVPAVKEYYEYLEAGGDPDRFHAVRQEAADYETLELNEDDEATQEHVVRQALIKSGYDDEDIQRLVSKYKDTGMLQDQAEVALKNLKKISIQEKEALRAEAEQTAQQQQEKVKKHWENVRNTVKSKSDFRGVPIPVKEQEAFMDFISKPANKQGYSARDLKVMDMKLEDRILLDYLIFKDLPLDKLIEKKAATKNAEGLRKRVRTGSNSPSSRKASQAGSSSGVPDTVSEAIEGLDLS